MSGTSTLRICLAAMAPALTEAASARLKLQDSSAKNESISVGKADKKSNEENLSKGDRSKDLHSLHTVSIRNRSNAVSHLLLSNEQRNPICFDQKRLTTLSNSCPQTIPANIKTLNFKVTHIDKLYDSEKLLVKNVNGAKPDQYFDNNKIMSHIVASKPNEQNKSSGISIEDGNEIFDSSCVAKTKIISPVMVNGESGFIRKAQNEDSLKDIDEKKDGLCNNNIQLKSEQKISSASFNSTSKLLESTKMGINVKHDQTVTDVILENTCKSEALIDEKTKEEMRKECIKKQIYLERKADILLRRLKRMKAKVVEAHAKEQFRHFMKFQHKNLQSVAKAIKNETPGPTELKEHFLSNDDVKNMSAAQLVKLVKNYQPNRITSTEDSLTSKLKLFSSNTVLMDASVCSSALKTSERLMQRVQTTSADLDSDATASSSGGESDDELGASVTSADLPPLIKRAEWKWVMDRAAVVARWTWLQAQVSDLEYRIRQQSQIYRQLRNSKGGVVLGDPPSSAEILRRFQDIQAKAMGVHGNEEKPGAASISSEVSPCNVSTFMSNVDKQAARLTQSLGNCLSPATSLIGSPAGLPKNLNVNGLTESPCSTSTDIGIDDSPSISKERLVSGKINEQLEHNSSLADASCHSARCRPLRSYRKRKILRTIGLYKTNSKAARLSDIRCRCYPPMTPCPICGGRYNNTLTTDPDTMSLQERVALLDPSFHPVLSFPQDVYWSIYCEGLLKSGLLQSKPLPRKTRVGESKRQKVINLISEPSKKSKQKGRNTTASVIHFTTKIKQKYEGKGKAVSSKGKSLKTCINRAKRKKTKAARAMKRSQQDDDEDLEAEYLEQETSMSSHKEHGLASSLSQSSLKDGVHQRKRKVDNSYDINNIVIPLSMATSTIEQPQYKEIVTPKWREISKSCSAEINIKIDQCPKLEVIQEKSKVIENVLDDEPIEDISDERYAARHLILEQEEKKRFRSFVQYPPIRRNRGRSDALSSSSGRTINSERFSTEESNITFVEDGYLSSQPSTPVINKSLSTFFPKVNDESYESQPSTSRRRTISLSKRERSSSLIFDDLPNFPDEGSGVKPWPRRTFPISESEYQLMIKELTPNCEPVHHRSVTRRILEPSVYVGNSENHEDVSNAPSPHPSNESLSSMGDDPNDTEWLEITKRGRSRTAINDDIHENEWITSDTRRGKYRQIFNDDANDPDWTSLDTRRRCRQSLNDDKNDPDWTGSDTPRKNKIKR
uniref:PEHE domain-containing protein n=1 Tax=Biomphalaria glabrata TaxID=6526 RepID=A0A2C9KRZ0_BIOGL